MKQIRVNEKCNGCGLCVMNCVYLQENEEGNAQPVVGKVINDADMENIQQIVKECPENALEIVETGSATKAGKEGAAEVAADLRKKCESLSVKQISRKDIKLDVEHIALDVPMFCDNQFEYQYSSESAAKSAAKYEFERLCYSEAACQRILKKVFVDYKINVLKPYYSFEKETDCVFFKYNEMIRTFLADAYAEICSLLGDGAVPVDWKSFSLYPDDEYGAIRELKIFDEKSKSYGIGIIAKLKEGYSCNEYVDFMRFDDMENYVGESFFGKSKYKTVWNFSNFNQAAERFNRDMKHAIKYKFPDIEEETANTINYMFGKYEKELKKNFNAKIDELERYLK